MQGWVINTSTAIQESGSPLKHRSLFLAETSVVASVALAIILALIIPDATFHFNRLVVSIYTNGSMDFAANASTLVRSLGTLSLLVLALGVVMGAVMSLTAFDVKGKQAIASVSSSDEYEKKVVMAGFLKVTSTQNGTTYAVTEQGKRFLRDYAFLSEKMKQESTQLAAPLQPSKPNIDLDRRSD